MPKDFKMYEIPFAELSQLRPEIEKIIKERYPIVIQGYPFPSPNNIELMSFMNHSDKPNCYNDTALRDIKKGEEITEDYRRIEGYKKIFKFLK